MFDSKNPIFSSRTSRRSDGFSGILFLLHASSLISVIRQYATSSHLELIARNLRAVTGFSPLAGNLQENFGVCSHSKSHLETLSFLSSLIYSPIDCYYDRSLLVWLGLPTATLGFYSAEQTSTQAKAMYLVPCLSVPVAITELKT
ncbi:hypothetical protein VNO77_22595 [Canavalia gladiata]|uniref:Uncharacterized protein n=1 Tax=Canavalia gladiata TaxID=3824 RepID=A0AAN9L3T6_CANGL